jgi:hypothetical protein
MTQASAGCLFQIIRILIGKRQSAADEHWGTAGVSTANRSGWRRFATTFDSGTFAWGLTLRGASRCSIQPVSGKAAAPARLIDVHSTFTGMALVCPSLTTSFTSCVIVFPASVNDPYWDTANAMSRSNCGLTIALDCSLSDLLFD